MSQIIINGQPLYQVDLPEMTLAQWLALPVAERPKEWIRTDADYTDIPAENVSGIYEWNKRIVLTDTTTTYTLPDAEEYLFAFKYGNQYFSEIITKGQVSEITNGMNVMRSYSTDISMSAYVNSSKEASFVSYKYANVERIGQYGASLTIYSR